MEDFLIALDQFIASSWIVVVLINVFLIILFVKLVIDVAEIRKTLHGDFRESKMLDKVIKEASFVGDKENAVRLLHKKAYYLVSLHEGSDDAGVRNRCLSSLATVRDEIKGLGGELSPPFFDWVNQNLDGVGQTPSSNNSNPI